jgi:predicted RNA binding protein YcfA (HicA-like mRNA interferase family)
VTKWHGFIDRVLSGESDHGIGFEDICGLLLHLGFEVRIRGSHHLFRKQGIEERINLQRDGNKAKPYQVKQVRNIILKHHLQEEFDG